MSAICVIADYWLKRASNLAHPLRSGAFLSGISLYAISAFGWVAIYSYLIHPGEAPSYYENYAQFASPVISVVLGIPYWFFACRWVGQKAGTRAVAMCVWAWVILFLIDFPLNFLAEQSAYSWMMVAISLSTKLLAAYLGGRAALKRVS